MKKILFAVVAVTSLFTVSLPMAQQPAAPQTAANAGIRYSAFNAVQIANDDAITVAALTDPNLNPKYIRYLSLHNFPREKRDEVKANVDFVLNSLNARYRKIVRTATLPVRAADYVVLRVNLKDYGIDPDAWDRLAENGSGPTPLPDPYFHTFIVNDINTVPAYAAVIQAAPALPADWIPKLEVAYQDGQYSQQAEIYITVPGMKDVYFDGEKMPAKEGTTRNFNTPTLKDGKVYEYEIRVTGNYLGRDYDVNIPVECRRGLRANISMPVPVPQEISSKKIEPKKKVLASAPWLALELDPSARGTTIANLIKITGTKNPILRADWFVTYAVWAPAYYDLIGLPLRDNPDKEAAKKKPKVFLEKDFQKLLNVDEHAAAKDIVAAVTDTRIVTLHNRILHRFNTVTGVMGGYYWRSQDTDKGIDDEDYLNQIANFDRPSFIASEIIASGRNGLNLYFVADNNGVGLDLAIASVAQHNEAMPCKYQDKQVWVARNCMLCHAQGMIPVKDKVRTIARDKIALFIADKTRNQDVTIKIEEAFSPDPAGIIALDNAKFIASVRAACGKDGLAIGKSQENLIWRYWDVPVNLERMAWDAGVPPDKLKAMLQDGINLDYTLVSILQEPEEPISILAWERQGFAALMNYIISYQPKKIRR